MIKEQTWPLSQRGIKDAARHREKIRETIRKNIADIIGDASIITRRDGQTIKVPIRGIKSYQFIFKRPGAGGGGIGQGEGDVGDIIDRQLNPDGQPGQPGDEPGIDYLETEIDIEELIQMMFEDLGLPNLKKKEIIETLIPKGWKYNSIEKTGIIAHLDKKRSLKETIKRTASFVKELVDLTNRSELDCEKALAQAKGNLLEAEKILNENLLLGNESRIYIANDDLRFRTLTVDVEKQSNAVVIAMMDVSGSMGTIKKYLARSFYFWIVQFLKQIYANVQIRFIAHTTEAQLVDEYNFFHRGESGGTMCHTAYDLAIDLVEKEYPVDRWNCYCFLFSDGEDFDMNKTVESAKKLADMGINMLGYGEILDGYTSGWSSSSTLMNSLITAFKADSYGDRIWISKTLPFIGAMINDKHQIYDILKVFLQKEMSWD